MTRLKITVERIDGYCNLPMLVGDHFYVDGSKLRIPEDGHICMWALQAMMPVFPIKQASEDLSDDHWVKGVKYFQCPDPDGKVIYKIEMVDHDSG